MSKVAGLFFVLFFSLNGFSEVIHAFDFDNTIFRNSNMKLNGKRGVFDIPMVLVKIDRPSNLLYANTFPDSGELFKEVSVYDFEKLRKENRLAKNNGSRGDVLGERATQSYKMLDGSVIYPGFYKIVPEITYKYYRDDQMLVDTVKKSLQHPDGAAAWGAYGYPYFKLLMNHPELHKTVKLYSARGNSASGMIKAFDELIAAGEIKYGLKEHQIYAVNGKDGWKSGQPYHSPARQKANLLHRDIISASRFFHRDESTYVMMNNELGPNHVVYFFDDDAKYLEEVVKYVKGTTSGPGNNVKFVYYNLGFYPDETLLERGTRSGNKIEKTYRYKPGVYSLEGGAFKRVSNSRELLAEGKLTEEEVKFVEKVNKGIFKNKDCRDLF